MSLLIGKYRQFYPQNSGPSISRAAVKSSHASLAPVPPATRYVEKADEIRHALVTRTPHQDRPS